MLTVSSLLKSKLSSDQISHLKILLAKLGRKSGNSVEEYWIDKLSKKGVISSVLQIGANDGESSDPVAYIIQKYKLSAILVEPLPVHYDKLRKKYGNSPNVKLFNTAVSDCNGQKKFSYLPEDTGLPDWANGLGSFDLEVITSHRDRIPDLAERIISIDISCVTLKTFVEAHVKNDIDLLVVDTEGHDYTILKQIQLAKISPKVIIFEYIHLSHQDYEDCTSLLTASDYIHIKCDPNVISFSRKVASEFKIKNVL